MVKKKDKVIRYASICFCIIIVLVLSYFRVFETFALQTLDLRFKIRPPQKVNPDIVIIEIAEDTIEKIGRFPFSRKYHAILIEALSQAKAKQIIFDVLFCEESADDALLIEATKKAKNVYFPYAFCLDLQKKGEITAECFEDSIIEKLKDVAASTGHINIVPDIDGKNRKAPIYIKFNGQYYPHLSFVAVCDYLNLKEDDIEFRPQDSIILRDKSAKRIIKIPLNKRNEILINYAGGWVETFKHYSFVDIVGSYLLEKENKEPLIDLSELEGKVCLIALTAAGLHDLQPMPLAQRYPGVGVHANIINSIITNNFLIRANKFINLTILIIWSTIIILLSKTSTYKGLICTISAVILYVIICFGLFIYLGIWIDLFYPVVTAMVLYLGITFYRLIVERHRGELLEKELSLARRIQESFLPAKPPQIEGFEIASSMNAARQVGGDLYQFVNLGKDKFGIMIADVSGKGIPAALFMVKIVTEFNAWTKQFSSPFKVLTELNNQLVQETKTGLFVTVSYPVIDVVTRKVYLADGGHLPLLWYQIKSDTVKEERPSKGIPLGLMPNAEYNETEFTLSKGDILAFYTDGVTEARNTKGEEFGFQRLKNIIKSEHSNTASEILKSIQEEIKRFSAKTSQHDDITLIILKVV